MWVAWAGNGVFLFSHSTGILLQDCLHFLNEGTMIEFVFRKAQLKELIEASADEHDEVLVRMAFSPATEGIHPAKVIARCQKTGDTAELGEREIAGCPRPPGCG